MKTLHQIIANEPNVQKQGKAIYIESLENFKNKRHLFEGSIKRHKLNDSSRASEEYDEVVALTTTVPARLNFTLDYLAKKANISIRRDIGNSLAKGNLIFQGKILAKDVPVTVFLTLERELKEILALFKATPTLKPGIEWEYDSNNNYYVNKNPEVRLKTEKSKKVITKAASTDKHPAQAEVFDDQATVGRIIIEEISGTLSSATLNNMINLCEELITAVRNAREEANRTEVPDTEIGLNIVNLFRETLKVK